MELRNLIINAYREAPGTRLSAAAARARAAADAGAVGRVHAFLDHWGIINFQAPPMAPTPAVADISGAPGCLRAAAGADALFRFPPASVAAGVAAAAGVGAPAALAAAAGRRDRWGRAPGSAPAPAPRFFCSALPWVDCTETRWHCTKVPDVDLCPQAYAEGRFPAGSTARDFVRVDGGAPPPPRSTSVVGGAGAGDGWTPSETLLLLEGVEMHGQAWSDVADHVGSKSAFACVRRFLALPLTDEVMVDLEAPAGGGGAPPADGPGSEEEAGGAPLIIPFADAGNPVMAQVAFLAHMVGPRVAAAAAAAALEALADGAGEGATAMTPLPSSATAAAAAAGLAAAAVKARLMADAEEREVVRLAGAAAAALARRVEAKAAALDALEAALERERGAADAARDAAYAERRALEAARVSNGG